MKNKQFSFTAFSQSIDKAILGKRRVSLNPVLVKGFLVVLAKLASEKPEFHNQIHVCDAQRLRDLILNWSNQ